MSIATIRQSIIDNAHSLVTAAVVDRAIIQAMRFHRDKRLWFSERTFKFDLVQGQASYAPGDGLPLDCTEIVGRAIWYLIGGSDDQRFPVIRQTTVEFEYQRQMGISQDYPQSWDYFDRKLRLYPTPPAPGATPNVLEGRYVIDIGVPVVKYDVTASTYVFYTPDGLTQLTATELAEFDNDWTAQNGAAGMIEARAAHLLHKNYLKDPDAANEWLTAWLEQVGLMEDETDARTAGATEIRPCILD